MIGKFVDAWFDAVQTSDNSKLEFAFAEDFVHTNPFGKIGSKQKYLDLLPEKEEAFFSPTLGLMMEPLQGKVYAN